MSIERILVPIDFSAISMDALDTAVEFSRPYEAEIVVMFAVEPTGSPILERDSEAELAQQAHTAENKLEEICRSLGRGGISCSTRIEIGSAAEAIIGAATALKADLIVMSTHGRSGLKRALIGSVAEKVVRRARCPILLLRSFADLEKPDSRKKSTTNL